MKTKIEIIEETAAYYNLGNRSVTKSGRCYYNGPDGKQCAFARMCIDPTQLKEGLFAGNQLHVFGEEILKPEYRGHSLLFYDALQWLHDNQKNWTYDGLSEWGKHKVAEMKNRWGESLTTETNN
jgi:hypothetical protein